MLTQSLSNRSNNFIVDGCRSKLGNILTGVQQGRVQGTLLLLLDISELFSILEYKLIGYANDPTLFAVVSSLCIRIAVAQSLNRDLGYVSECCGLCGMKLNASKTNTLIGFRPRTMHPQSPPLTSYKYINQYTNYVLTIHLIPR